MTGPKIYFTIPILGGIPITQTLVSSFVVMVLLCVAGILLGRNLQKRPSRRQVLVEKGMSMLYDMVRDTMGEHNLYWTPYIGALFLSSLGGTLIGMTGVFRSATADLSTTGTWAIMTSVLCWGCGIRANGFRGWLKGFADPVPVMLPMNIVSEISQPISMAFRHFGNISGGGVLTSMLYTALAALSAIVLEAVSSNLFAAAALLVLGLVLLVWGFRVHNLAPKIAGIVFAVTGLLAVLGLSGVPYLEVGSPGIQSLYFDVFSGGVQALVFSLLTMVYIGNCCPPPAETESPADP